MLLFSFFVRGLVIITFRGVSMSVKSSLPFLYEKNVISNLYAIASLKSGEKLDCSEQTGEISVDDRAYFVSFRRGYYGAHHNDVILHTFNAAMNLLKKHGEGYSLSSHAVSRGERQETLDKLFEKALIGLNTLARTYSDEGKDRGVASLLENVRREFVLLRQPSKVSSCPFRKEAIGDEGLFAESDDSDANSASLAGAVIDDAPKDEEIGHKAPATPPVPDTLDREVETESKNSSSSTTGTDSESDDPVPGPVSDDEQVKSLADLMMDDLIEIGEEAAFMYETVTTGVANVFQAVFGGESAE